MTTGHNLTVLNSKSKPNKRVLLTTPAWESVVPFFTNRRKHKVKISEINEKWKLLELCISAEVQMDFEWPFGGIHIIKENVPSLDVLDYPGMGEYEACLNEGNYDVVALSFYRFNIPQVVKMVEMARNYGVKEVWAGNYGANSPGMDKVFDKIFSGDGVPQMKALVEGEPLEYRRHPILMGTMMRGVPVGYLYTGVGCRYQCRFCPTTTFMPDPVYTSMEEIRRVLDVYVRNGIQSITILDETFLQDREHSDQVIQEFHKRGLVWHCTSRVSLLAGRVKELHKMGLRSIYAGVETLANHSLKYYKKGLTVSSILNLFKELNDLGIMTTITYIFGFEFDTTESILEAIQIIKNDIKPFCLSLLVMTPHANSQIDHLAPLIFDYDPTHFDSQHLVWKHPHLSPEDLYELLCIAHFETAHPKNLIKKRIVERLKAIKSGDSPLYSERVDKTYRENKNSDVSRIEPVPPPENLDTGVRGML